MRKIGTWIMSDDRHFLVTVGVAILLLVFVVRPLFWNGVNAAERALYERPASVSQIVEDRAIEYARLLVGDDVEIRFDGESACPDDADGCVNSISPHVIHLHERVGAAAADNPVYLVQVVLHEAAHVLDFEHDLDVEAFRRFSDTVDPTEVFADCVAQGLYVLADPAYLECPAEGRRLALDMLGIESATLGWVGDRITLDLRALTQSKVKARSTGETGRFAEIGASERESKIPGMTGDFVVWRG